MASVRASKGSAEAGAKSLTSAPAEKWIAAAILRPLARWISTVAVMAGPIASATRNTNTLTKRRNAARETPQTKLKYFLPSSQLSAVTGDPAKMEALVRISKRCDSCAALEHCAKNLLLLRCVSNRLERCLYDPGQARQTTAAAELVALL
ncbi:hypothetical protein AVEN_211108-1 [Araneus ventricosus]|uniref:Uncharacterized protein n=1 Tax=Araneus ventricosus TaxID=182803 RepID=A0A4Y2RIZ7_ARAVE|nr:hypothetical protein AVEN_211108-1 [Araneus ventricosus]